LVVTVPGDGLEVPRRPSGKRTGTASDLVGVPPARALVGFLTASERWARAARTGAATAWVAAEVSPPRVWGTRPDVHAPVQPPTRLQRHAEWGAASAAARDAYERWHRARGPARRRFAHRAYVAALQEEQWAGEPFALVAAVEVL
jgi:hypothetical protein